MLDLLGGYGMSLGIVGTSKGAEAALLVASTNADVEVVMVFHQGMSWGEQGALPRRQE